MSSASQSSLQKASRRVSMRSLCFVQLKVIGFCTDDNFRRLAGGGFLSERGSSEGVRGGRAPRKPGGRRVPRGASWIRARGTACVYSHFPVVLPVAILVLTRRICCFGDIGLAPEVRSPCPLILHARFGPLRRADVACVPTSSSWRSSARRCGNLREAPGKLSHSISRRH